MTDKSELLVAPTKMFYDQTILEEAPKPLTNADRIRAMSDEELAVFLERSTGGCETCAADCVCNGPEDLPAKEVCHQGVLVWLRQPATEEKKA